MLLLGYTPIPFFPKNIHGTDSLLKLLNVNYKPARSFWLSNEGQLPWIYEDFRVAARKLKGRLHPDRGGNLEQFTRFNIHCDMAARCFNKYGIGPPVSIATLMAQHDDRRIKSRARQKVYAQHVRRRSRH